jgi:hypothetical protein
MQHMVATSYSPHKGGMEGTPHHEGSSSNDSFFMCDHMVNLQTRENNYDTFKIIPVVRQATYASYPSVPI